VRKKHIFNPQLCLDGFQGGAILCGTIEIKSLVAVTQAVYFVELLNNHLPLLRQFVLGLSHPVVASFAIVKINNMSRQLW